MTATAVRMPNDKRKRRKDQASLLTKSGTTDDFLGDKNKEDIFLRKDTEGKRRNTIKYPKEVSNETEGLQKRNLKPRRKLVEKDKAVVNKTV